MRLILAPMQGVLDHLMRELLTQINPYDLCVTEFVRVSDGLLPERSFFKLCPELKNGCVTSSGTTVRVQLLGQDPAKMAANAKRAIELGSPGVDLNFGCPAKLVNRSKGGAVLLKEPHSVFEVVDAVRQAVPSDLPVTAKMRLGWDSTQQAVDIAGLIQQAGASELAVHGRTKEDGYRKGTVDWQRIGDINRALDINVVANGDIVDWASAQACLEATGCSDLMVGRGALNRPNLGAMVKQQTPSLAWEEVVELLQRYSHLEMEGDKGLYFANRVKQWFTYLVKSYPEARDMFDQIKPLKAPEAIRPLLSVAA
ncbi:tRNA dihydrouridine(16) synthase DusC [Paraferrimonas sedimenticola]|uniref:tRNA-dihydrouridine(16) synthase n=1 Tax=Paraferrimonas sedimenticola TaxID=375674 RepID=A0AA37W1V7_9GAMM|nr:tRNA dihydrouridine(16) synthase DusC [Paraferrimonas sedimenticola]GLP96912.1 tRNA-dihydrouridine(16) synthase [Paraferrimonas sedimenticola]